MLNWLCFIQTDPTKVESVQDVLARAAAKGLLGAIISEPSKTGKKKKSRKKRAASATSKPPSPSCQAGEDGEESSHGRDSEETSEHEEEKDERALEDGEDNVAERKDEVKDEKKQRRRKRKTKQSKKAPTDTTSHKKKKKKRETQSQMKTQVSNKPRRIPRLTLTLISSANPSRRLSPITALAHKISGTPVVRAQQAGPRPPPLSGKQSSPAQPASNKTQNTPLKGGAEAPTQLGRPQSEVMKPPVSSPSFNNSSVCQLPSQTFIPQLSNFSASSSSASLPEL